MLNQWFPKIDNKDVALRMSKIGSTGMFMYIIFTFGELYARLALGKPTEKHVVTVIIVSIILIPIELIMAARIHAGKGWLASVLVLAWIIIGTVLDILHGTEIIGEVIVYFVILLMIANGFRGCWYIKNANNSNGTTNA